jgi:hypothetical protein
LIAIQSSQFSDAIFAPCAEALEATHYQVKVLPSQILCLVCGGVAGGRVKRPCPIKMGLLKCHRQTPLAVGVQLA